MDQPAKTVPDGVEPLVTVREAGRRLAISRAFPYQHLQRGTLPSAHIGRARRVRVADLEVFVQRQQLAVMPPLVARVVNEPAAGPPWAIRLPRLGLGDPARRSLPGPVGPGQRKEVLRAFGATL